MSSASASKIKYINPNQELLDKAHSLIAEVTKHAGILENNGHLYSYENLGQAKRHIVETCKRHREKSRLHIEYILLDQGISGHLVNTTLDSYYAGVRDCVVRGITNI